MPGGVLMAVVMVLIIPIGVMITGAVWSALLGWCLNSPAEVVEPTGPGE